MEVVYIHQSKKRLINKVFLDKQQEKKMKKKKLRGEGGELPKKEGLGQFADLRWDLAKEKVVFLR